MAGGTVWGVCWMTPWLAPLIPAWFVLLFLALGRARSARQAVRIGALSGITRYVVGAHFLLALTAVSPLGVVIYLLAILYVIPFAMGATWLAWRFEARTGLPRQLALVGLYPMTEWLRAASPASLPADLMAHAFGGRPPWLSMTAWTGPWGVTLWAGAVAWLLWAALAFPRRRVVALAAAVPLYAVPLAAAWAAPAARGDGPAFKVAIVQPSLTLAQKLDAANAPLAWQRLEEMTRAAARGVDLVVWGETLRPGALSFRADRPFHDPEVERIARDVGVPILYGAVLARIDGTGDGFDGLFNAVALARPDGRPGQWYGKQQLVPFVEGLPFAQLFGYRPHVTPGRKRSWITLLGNFSPGPEITIFDVGPARIGALICYEGLYPGYARDLRARGANLLVVAVNDAWWGRTFFSRWHTRMLAARAVENGVPVVRAGNSGVSCTMEADGRITGQTRMFTVETLAGEVRLAPGTGTAYTRTGDVLLGVLLVALAATFAFRRAAPSSPRP